MFNSVFAAVRHVLPDSTPSQKSQKMEDTVSITGIQAVPSSDSDELDIIQIERPDEKTQYRQSDSQETSWYERREKGDRSTTSHSKRHKYKASNGFERRYEGRGYANERESKERYRSPPPRNDRDRHERHYPPREMRKLPVRERRESYWDEDRYSRDSRTMPQHDMYTDQDADAYHKLQDENELLKAELDQQRRAFQAMERELRSRLERAEAQHEKTKKEFSQCEKYCASIESQLEQIKVEANVHMRTCGERDALLDVRTKELNAAQAFLTMTDTCSGSDVINMVERLNAEIMQMSAFMADLVEDLQEENMKCLPWEKSMPPALQNYATFAIGEDLLTYLKQRGTAIRKDTFPLQTAIQATLVEWVHFNISRFCGGETDIENAFDSLYKRIRKTETQAVSAKWRAITSHKFYPALEKNMGDLIQPTLVGFLAMAGWSPGSKDQETVAFVGESLVTIHKLAMEVKVAIKQGIVSCDLDIAAVPHPVEFDPLTMTDSGNNGSKASASTGKTLCTVALGLKKSTAVQSEKKPGKYGLVHQMLLKPEVVLASSLHTSGNLHDEDVKMEE